MVGHGRTVAFNSKMLRHSDVASEVLLVANDRRGLAWRGLLVIQRYSTMLKTHLDWLKSLQLWTFSTSKQYGGHINSYDTAHFPSFASIVIVLTLAWLVLLPKCLWMPCAAKVPAMWYGTRFESSAVWNSWTLTDSRWELGTVPIRMHIAIHWRLSSTKYTSLSIFINNYHI